MLRLAPLIVVALATIQVGTARADRATVVVYGATPPHARAVVASAFTSVLTVAGWQMASLPDLDVQAVARCIERDHPWRCIEPIVRGETIDRIVVVALAPDASATDLVLTATLVLADSEELARSREPCQRCGDAVLETTARGLATEIVDHAQRFARTILAVTAEPRAAAISIDGKPQGSGTISFATSAGPHTVSVEQAGYRTETRRVDVAAGKETAIDVRLTAEPGAGRATWPLIIAGAGVAAAVTGTIISLRVSPPPPTEPQPKYLYSGPGIGLAVVGVLAAVAGVYLWHSSGPSVVVAPGGGTVSWATAF